MFRLSILCVCVCVCVCVREREREGEGEIVYIVRECTYTDIVTVKQRDQNLKCFSIENTHPHMHTTHILAQQSLNF